MSDLYNKLSEEFPQEMVGTLSKGGRNFLFIPVSEVITRMNKVVGVDGWSMTVIRCERDALDSEYVIAHVRVELLNDDSTALVTRDSMGGQKINRTKQDDIINLGDDFKGAVADAFKKAVQTLGVGLYLARSQDAREIEQVIDASNIEPTDHEVRWENFVGLSKSLNASQKTLLTKAWKKEYGDAPKPLNPNAVTDEALNFLLAEIIKVKFSATEVEPTAPHRADLA